MMRLGIVVVTFNSQRAIRACLNACRSFAPAASVVVVDNASTDGTLETLSLCPDVRVIANTKNAGFAAAANQGISALDCDIALLINPDVELLTGLEPIISAFEDPGVGAAGGLLLSDSGRPQSGFFVRRLPTPSALAFEVLGLNRLWPGNPVNRRYRALDLDPTQPADAEQPAGALLAIRREVWRRIGGLDESYFPIWFEDVDFCCRLREENWRIRYVPEVRAIHAGGHSIPSMSWSTRQLSWYGSLLRYVARHFRPAGRSMVCGAVMLAAVIRAVTGTVLRRSSQPLFVYGRVIRLAALSFSKGWARSPGAAADGDSG